MNAAPSRRVVIIGAGPTGLAAALSCLRRGYVPTVFEQGEVGASLRRFGNAKFFTPLCMNVPGDLLEIAGSARDKSAIVTGQELAKILEAASSSPLLKEHVQCNHRVVRVSRHNLARGDLAGHPVRAELPFRVVVTSKEGARVVEADAVLDASGIYDTPAPLLSAITDRLESKLIRDLGALAAAHEKIAGRRVLLVGHGHSAANAICELADLAARHRGTHVTWALRSRNLRPFAPVPSDPLPERERIVTCANEIASNPPLWLRVERAAFVESLASLKPLENGSIRVSMTGDRTCEVDHVVALTGYRPDYAHLSELPLEVSPATEGAMRLSRALANVTDCLSVPQVAREDFASGEPRFHLVGAKSYGRARTFLLQTGFAQLETVLDQLF